MREGSERSHTQRYYKLGEAIPKYEQQWPIRKLWCEKTVGDLGKLDISNICLYKVLLDSLAQFENVLPACINSDSSKVDTFLQDGLSIHYRSSHRRSELSKETVERWTELLREVVASETFGNLQNLSYMRRTYVRIKLFKLTRFNSNRDYFFRQY